MKTKNLSFGIKAVALAALIAASPSDGHAFGRLSHACPGSGRNGGFSIGGAGEEGRTASPYAIAEAEATTWDPTSPLDRQDVDAPGGDGYDPCDGEIVRLLAGRCHPLDAGPPVSVLRGPSKLVLPARPLPDADVERGDPRDVFRRGLAPPELGPASMDKQADAPVNRHEVQDAIRRAVALDRGSGRGVSANARMGCKGNEDELILSDVHIADNSLDSKGGMKSVIVGTKETELVLDEFETTSTGSAHWFSVLQATFLLIILGLLSPDSGDMSMKGKKKKTGAFDWILRILIKAPTLLLLFVVVSSAARIQDPDQRSIEQTTEDAAPSSRMALPSKNEIALDFDLSNEFGTNEEQSDKQTKQDAATNYQEILSSSTADNTMASSLLKKEDNSYPENLALRDLQSKEEVMGDLVGMCTVVLKAGPLLGGPGAGVGCLAITFTLYAIFAITANDHVDDAWIDIQASDRSHAGGDAMGIVWYGVSDEDPDTLGHVDRGDLESYREDLGGSLLRDIKLYLEDNDDICFTHLVFTVGPSVSGTGKKEHAALTAVDVARLTDMPLDPDCVWFGDSGVTLVKLHIEWTKMLECYKGALSSDPSRYALCMKSALISYQKNDKSQVTARNSGLIRNKDHKTCLQGGDHREQVRRATCDSGDSRQNWHYEPDTHRIKNDYNNLCLDKVSNEITTHQCHGDTNQKWFLVGEKLFSMRNHNECIMTFSNYDLGVYDLGVVDCVDKNSGWRGQHWSFKTNFFSQNDKYRMAKLYYPYMDSGLLDVKKSSNPESECETNSACVGFNTNGWLKQRIRPYGDLSTWTKDGDKGLYVHSPVNYKFHPRVDSHGNDLKKVTGNIETIAAVCNAIANCEGFNSNGFLKHTINDEWKTWTGNDKLGFYAKVEG